MKTRWILLSFLSLTLLAGCVAGQRMVVSENAGGDAGGEAGTETTVRKPAALEHPVEATVGAVKEAGATRGSTAAVSIAAGLNEVDSPEEPFTASSKASGGTSLNADSILAVRYGDHEGYERIVIDLGSGSEPAKGVQEWTLISPTGDGLLRVSFPSVISTRVSDGDLDGELLKDFHVVRGPENGMFADFFATGAFAYRVL